MPQDTEVIEQTSLPAPEPDAAPDRHGAPLIAVTGTSGNGWVKLARRLIAARQDPPDTGPQLICVDMAELAVLLQSSTDLRCLGLVESPDRTLAASGDTTAQELFADWSRSARELLRLSRQRPARWCLVDVDELEAAPQALADHLAGWGLTISVDSSPFQADRPDPLVRHLAQALVQPRPALRRLHEELHTSCLPLLDGPAATADPSSLWAAHKQASSQRRALLQQLELTRQELTAAKCVQDSLQDELRLLREGAHQSAQEARQREEELRREEALLLSQLRTTQEALEAGALQADERAAKLAQAELASHQLQSALTSTQEDLQASQEEAQSLKARLTEVNTELAFAASRLTATQTEHSALLAKFQENEWEAQSRLEELESQLSHTSAELSGKADQCALLGNELDSRSLQLTQYEQRHREQLLQLEQVQQELTALQLSAETAAQAHIQQVDELREHSTQLKSRYEQEQQKQKAQSEEQRRLLLLQVQSMRVELESHYRRANALQNELDQEHSTTREPERVASLRALGSSDRSPHRHIDIELRGLRLSHRQVGDLTVRLVEHGGQPGLLFWQNTAQPPILAWNANGQEDQRAFMLLLPGTESGRTQLARMGSLDWQMVLGTAKLLLQCLPEAPAPLPAWAAVAARLVRELQALPPRLRYDAVSSCSAAADTTGVRPVELCFQGSSFGDLNLGNLRLLWQPVQRQLSCLAPERAGQLALAHWPLSGDGSLQPNLKLPVGKGEGAQQRTQWAALADTDRSLLLGLLDALPGAAAQVDTALLPPNWRTEQLVQQAHELHRQARRLQGRLSAFATARRLLRRPAAAAD